MFVQNDQSREYLIKLQMIASHHAWMAQAHCSIASNHEKFSSWYIAHDYRLAAIREQKLAQIAYMKIAIIRGFY